MFVYSNSFSPELCGYRSFIMRVGIYGYEDFLKYIDFRVNNMT